MELGGYGGYVWPAYGVSALAIGLTIFATIRRTHRLRRRMEAIEGQNRFPGGVKSVSSKQGSLAHTLRPPVKIPSGPAGAVGESTSRSAS